MQRVVLCDDGVNSKFRVFVRPAKASWESYFNMHEIAFIFYF